MSKNRIYELTVLIHPQLEEDARKQLVEQITKMVSADEGAEEQIAVTHWGSRSMAYEIKNCREAYYVYFEGPMDGSKIREIERQFIYNDDILRYLFVRKED